jgi:hypothetical protein
MPAKWNSKYLSPHISECDELSLSMNINT